MRFLRGLIVAHFALIVAVVGCRHAPGPSGKVESTPSRTLSIEEWAIEIDTAGGFTGYGAGDVTVDSRGNLTAEIPRPQPGQYCQVQVKTSAREMRSLNRLISSAKPDSWSADYVNPKSRCEDDYGFTLRLRYQTADGKKEAFTAGWDGCAMTLLPNDLNQIQEIVMSAGNKALERCRTEMTLPKR